MIKISQSEMFKLQEKGFVFDEHLHKTYSNRGNNRYYATTTPKLMKALTKMREESIVYTKEQKEN